MNSFDAKINTENLTKCLQTLKQFYGDLLKDKVKGVSGYHTLTTFINGGAFCYSFVFMLIRPTRLTLV